MNENLEKIIIYIISQKPQTKAQFDDAKRKICGQLKIKQPSNRELLQAYQIFTKKERLEPDKTILMLIRKAGIRTQSGIAVVTSLTKPFPCPGQCIYCPNEVGMPKSYLASEPAAARALSLKFDPYEQMQRRIEMLEANGHPTDKIEFIVKGGTWNAYPLKYQYWFILESFKACNNLKRKKPKVAIYQYNNITIKKLQLLLEEEQAYNERATHRIIGLTLETRPDAITIETIKHMRNQGCTRIELGLQAPDDEILTLVKRGHTVQHFKDAMLMLREAGFKVDLHFMPGLPGSTSQHDVEMYQSLFTDPGLKPDMVKIYPCTVIKSSPLNAWFESGKYKPYSDEELFNALIQMKSSTPRYCRISRLIRDIPTNEIEGGNTITNLREYLQKEMESQGLKCNCLRCREIGHQNTLALEHMSTIAPKLFVDEYETTGGTEYFLSYEDKDRTTVFGFLRLRLPNSEPRTLKHGLLTAFIRELHVYGELVPLQHDSTRAHKHTKIQHKGLGKKLVKEAEKITKKAGYKKITVISGVGVKDYYRKLGYRKDKTYMSKNL